MNAKVVIARCFCLNDFPWHSLPLEGFQCSNVFHCIRSRLPALAAPLLSPGSFCGTVDLKHADEMKLRGFEQLGPGCRCPCAVILGRTVRLDVYLYQHDMGNKAHVRGTMPKLKRRRGSIGLEEARWMMQELDQPLCNVSEWTGERDADAFIELERTKKQTNKERLWLEVSEVIDFGGYWRQRTSRAQTPQLGWAGGLTDCEARINTIHRQQSDKRTNME